MVRRLQQNIIFNYNPVTYPTESNTFNTAYPGDGTYSLSAFTAILSGSMSSLTSFFTQGQGTAANLFPNGVSGDGTSSDIINRGDFNWLFPIFVAGPLSPSPPTALPPSPTAPSPTPPPPTAPSPTPPPPTAPSPTPPSPTVPPPTPPPPTAPPPTPPPPTAPPPTPPPPTAPPPTPSPPAPTCPVFGPVFLQQNYVSFAQDLNPGPEGTILASFPNSQMQRTSFLQNFRSGSTYEQNFNSFPVNTNRISTFSFSTTPDTIVTFNALAGNNGMQAVRNVPINGTFATDSGSYVYSDIDDFDIVFSKEVIGVGFFLTDLGDFTYSSPIVIQGLKNGTVVHSFSIPLNVSNTQQNAGGVVYIGLIGLRGFDTLQFQPFVSEGVGFDQFTTFNCTEIILR
jgi:hypothetical protein